MCPRGRAGIASALPRPRRRQQIHIARGQLAGCDRACGYHHRCVGIAKQTPLLFYDRNYYLLLIYYDGFAVFVVFAMRCVFNFHPMSL